MANITFNPTLTTGIPDAFVTATDGYVQGTFLDDPATRYQLEGGVVASGQTPPLWGGLPLTLLVPQLGQNATGPTATAAASIAAIDAWCLFNQASAGIIAPGSNVPLYPAGTSINFARPGSNMRIALPVDPALVDSLVGASPEQQVAWDFAAHQIVAYVSGAALPVRIEFVNITSKTVTYDGGTGLATWNPTGAVAICRI